MSDPNTRQLLIPEYEKSLGMNSRWALSEGSRHFEEKSKVFDALRNITKRLNDLQISYAVMGGMALFQHGLRRFTEDVDILVSKQDLSEIHHRLDGFGYLPAHKNSKNLRDTESGVRIEFLTTGDFPGDGKPKPVAFPDPQSASMEVDGIRYLNLPTLIELKLASGMTNPSRLKDLADVLELAKLLRLPAEFSEQLNPYVREKFLELRSQSQKRYVTLWRNIALTSDAKSIDEMAAVLKQASETLEQMRRDGVFLVEDSEIADDYALLATNDPQVAEKYDMVEESEYWGTKENEKENPLPESQKF